MWAHLQTQGWNTHCYILNIWRAKVKRFHFIKQNIKNFDLTFEEHCTMRVGQHILCHKTTYKTGDKNADNYTRTFCKTD